MHDDMQPDNMNQEPIGSHGQVDREGAMAKADLYKLANYSLKLFKKMHDDAQLEGWVQAKITKAADYIASVYHYLEYEMEFSDYGAKLDNSEMYSEDQKLAIKNKLMEAKEKVAELKKLQAGKKAKEEKVKEGFDDKAKVGDTKKTRTGELTKTSTGVIHKNTSYADDGDAEEKSGKGIKSHAKAQSAAEKKDRAPKQKQSPKSAKTWGMKDSEKFDNRDKVAEAKDKGDMDHDGKDEPDDQEYKQNKDVAIKKAMGKKEKKVDETQVCNETPKGKNCPVHGMKECSMEESTKQTMSRAAKGHEKYGKEGMAALAKAGKEGKDLDKVRDKYDKYDESAKPSAGMSAKEKSATVKKAKAGGDIGKPGKNFDKVAKAAGGGEKGEKIAAAAMWKNKAKSLKESLDAMSETAMDQMDSSLIQLIQRAKEKDPEGLEQAMQQGPEKLTMFLQSTLSDINSATEPKDMLGMGDLEAEEGMGMDIANAATFGLAKPVVAAVKNPGAFVQGAANQVGQEVGNAVNTVQGVVQGAQQIRNNIKQGVSDVANAAVQGYQQARSPKMPPVANYDMTSATEMPKIGAPRTANTSMAAKVGAPRTADTSMTTPNTIRESAELDRMKQFLTRLNG